MYHAIYGNRIRTVYDIHGLASEANLTIDIVGETIAIDDINSDDDDFVSTLPSEVSTGDMIVSKNSPAYHRTYVEEADAGTLVEVIAGYCDECHEPIAIYDEASGKVHLSDTSVFSIASFIADGASTLSIEDDVVDELLTISGLDNDPHVRQSTVVRESASSETDDNEEIERDALAACFPVWIAEVPALVQGAGIENNTRLIGEFRVSQYGDEILITTDDSSVLLRYDGDQPAAMDIDIAHLQRLKTALLRAATQ